MVILESLDHPRVRQWLPVGLNIAVLLLLTASLAQWTWLFLKPALPKVISDTRQITQPSGNLFNIQPLLHAYLFGQAQAELGGDVSDLPISSLNLVLNGVIASGDGGHALISVNGKPQEPFAVGDAITGGAVLQAVYPDRAVIMRNGALESILLEGTESIQSAKISNVLYQPPSAPSGVRKLAKNKFIVPRAQLTEQIRSPDFLNQLSLSPLKAGGFLVRKVQAKSLYSSLGLRAGDVIKSINNESVNNIDDIMRFYQQMSELGNVQIEIRRAGRKVVLSYELQ